MRKLQPPVVFPPQTRLHAIEGGLRLSLHGYHLPPTPKPWWGFWRVAVFAGGLLLALVALRSEWPADGGAAGIAGAVGVALFWPLLFWWTVPRCRLDAGVTPELNLFAKDVAE